MGHAAEERLLGVLVLPGHLEGLLQQPALPQLPLLLLLHLPEAEDHLLRLQRLVEEDPDADPAVLLPKPARELPAEVPHPLPDQLPDVLTGEALREIPVNIRLDDLPGGAEQVGVGAGGRDPLPDIVRALDHLIGLPLVVHPVQGVVGVAQHLGSLIGPPRPGLQALFPHGQKQHHQERHREHQQEGPEHRPQAAQDPVIGHRGDGVPAVVHLGVVDAPALAVQVPDDGIVLQLPGLYLRHQIRQITLQVLLAQFQSGPLIDDGPRTVAEEEGVLLRQIRRVKVQALRQDIEGHHDAAVQSALGGSDHRPVIDHIRIHRREDHCPLRRHRLLIPGRVLIVVGIVPLPGVGGQDLPVQHHIGIHHAPAQHGVHPGEIHVQKRPDLLPALSVLQPFLQRGGAEGEEGLIYIQIAPLLRGAAAGQGRMGLIGVIQHGGPEDPTARQSQHPQNREGAQGKADLPEQPPPAAPLIPLHLCASGWPPSPVHRPARSPPLCRGPGADPPPAGRPPAA